MKRTFAIRAAVVAAATVGAVAVFGGPAHSEGATVTSGEFHPFATAAPSGINAATYADLAGRARMIRTADGRTIVTTHATGLLPETAYGSHVHAAACSAGEADGHYKHDPSGPPTPPNEIWP